VVSGSQNNLCRRGVCVVQCVLQAVRAVHIPQKGWSLFCSEIYKDQYQMHRIILDLCYEIKRSLLCVDCAGPISRAV